MFPSLTVAENLRLATWSVRDRTATTRARAEALALFPRLDERADQHAGDLSGGEQQMLTLAMALAASPRLLMIDELSLGLAPEVTERLHARLRDLRDAGTAVVVVEQSIDRAVELADRAYFLDQGTIRYVGAAAGLLEQPGLVRATFLGAAAQVPAPLLTPVVEPDREPLLELTGVDRRFGGVVALADVSLTVRAMEIVGVIGPNGAGKTTLFDVVSGFVPADSGTIVLGAGPARNDVTRLPAHRRAQLGLGRSFQDGRLFPALTVRETIAVACERGCASAIRSPPPRTSRRWRAPRPRCAQPSTSSSTCCGSANSWTGSVTSSRPAPAASSISRACSPTVRGCSSSTSPPAVSPNEKPRPSGRCSATCATSSAPACSWSNTTSASSATSPTAWSPSTGVG